MCSELINKATLFTRENAEIEQENEIESGAANRNVNSPKYHTRLQVILLYNN